MSDDVETRPLLDHTHQDESNAQDSQDIYDRFNKVQRRSILFVVAFAGLLPMFVWKAFVPTIPQVALDLSSDETTVSLAVSLTVLATAASSLFWASHSSVYGRRLMYLWGIPFLCIGSVGLATATSIPALFVWRFLQCFGCSSRFALGTGVVGDVFRLEERGTALGIFYGVVLVGTMLAPVVGGAFTRYASWRDLHVAVALWGILDFLLIFFSLPETSHLHLTSNKGPTLTCSRRPRFVNPFKCLALLRSPNLFIAELAAALALFTEFVLLIPLALTLGKQYNITSEAVLGACFLPQGIGNLIGAPIAGRMSDATVQKWRRKRGGKWVPEDRLQAVYIGGLILLPCSLIVFGFATTYIEGTIGLTISLFALFTGGLGVDFVLNPANSYCIDLVHSRSAEVTAAGNAFRSLVMAVGISLVVPSILRFGVLLTNCFAALSVLFVYGLVWLTIRFGDRMRAWVDIGYTTRADE
ncbi:major facilitator superfamily domain-containing protein [Phlebopus sp. FC_14]|nr:major facilitator superfamily domain-containing protein [Phlebopus sp. FC_14]